MSVSEKHYDDLKAELKQAKDDLTDAQSRIDRIEKVIWGKDPHSLEPDPDAIITIMRDIRAKLPDIDKIRSEYNFRSKLKFMLWGNASLFAIIGSLWAVVKFIIPLFI